MKGIRDQNLNVDQRTEIGVNTSLILLGIAFTSLLGFFMWNFCCEWGMVRK